MSRIDLAWARTLAVIAATLAIVVPAEADTTLTPIAHVILIIGENHSFDNLFGLYRPARGQTVRNLLSRHILDADGNPGPNFAHALQWQASDTTVYSVHPAKTRPFDTLPRPNTNIARQSPPFRSVAEARAAEPALPRHAHVLLTTGGTGLPNNVVDTRFPANLANGPFRMTGPQASGKPFVAYDSYTGDPVHRFFQMWQQLDCDVARATAENPSGCQGDLFPWVEVSVGVGSHGGLPPDPFTDESTHEGALSMGIYDSAAGDVPYLTRLADHYALADNYHQAIMGGTVPNHIALGYGGPIFYAGAGGVSATPPANQIENPDPVPGTNNWYRLDGPQRYVDCSDRSQPGVAPILDYLASLPHVSFRIGNCRNGASYLVNNSSPGFLGNGERAKLGPDQFAIPPTRQPNLGLLLSAHGVSWRYYGEGWDGGREDESYCASCNPFLYSTQIMTSRKRVDNLADIQDLYDDIAAGALPAVAIVKPDAYVDGHPATSKVDLFEAFCRKIVEMVKANTALWYNTAIMITFDEGGGYWDSGYVQPIDFFGDGTRVPLIVVSPYSKGRGVVHTYDDHVSFDKFVEANWRLPPISRRSRDNLPNPVARPGNPYVPTNPPAIGDLMDMFDFTR